MDELPSNWLGLLFAEGEAALSHTSTGAVLLKLFLVPLLVAANGFFVAAEFDLVGVRSSRIETLAAAERQRLIVEAEAHLTLPARLRSACRRRSALRE